MAFPMIQFCLMQTIYLKVKIFQQSLFMDKKNLMQFVFLLRYRTPRTSGGTRRSRKTDAPGGAPSSYPPSSPDLPPKATTICASATPPVCFPLARACGEAPPRRTTVGPHTTGYTSQRVRGDHVECEVALYPLCKVWNGASQVRKYARCRGCVPPVCRQTRRAI